MKLFNSLKGKNSSPKPTVQLHPQTVVDLLTYHVGDNELNFDAKKELILTVGRAQTGKSVLINTMCGVEFKYDKTVKDLVPTTELVAEVGNKATGNFDCTVFPKVYFSNKLGGYIMDTPGYLGMDGIDLKVTKEQSIRLSIQHASKVKIVFLVSCKDLEGIQQLSRTFVDILGNISINNASEVLLYVLANRYEITTHAMNELSGLTKAEQNDYILNDVQKAMEKAVEHIESQWKRLNERLKQRVERLKASGTSDEEIQHQIQNEADYHEMMQSAATVNYLKNSIKNKYVGYFEPTDPYSVEKTVQGIRSMKAVDPSSFDFTMYQTEWLISKRCLEEELFTYKEYLTAEKLSKMYPKTFFETVSCILNDFISKMHNDLFALQNKDNIDALRKKYNSDVEEQIKSVANEIKKMKAEVAELTIKKKQMENKNDAVLFEQTWYKEGSFSDYGSKIITYPLSKDKGYPVNVPIIDRKIKTKSPTFIYSDDYRPEDAFSRTEFRSVTAGEWCSAAIGSVFKGFLFFAWSKYKEYEEEVKQQACKGTIVFYGKESDKEWADFAEKGNRIDALIGEIQKKEEELKTLEEANEKSIENMIQKSIDSAKKQKIEFDSLRNAIIAKINRFSTDVPCDYIEKGEIARTTLPFLEKLDRMYRLCKSLTLKNEITENIRTFIAMYEELQELEKHPNPVTPTLDNLRQLCSEMNVELNKYNNIRQQTSLQKQ